MLGRSRKQNQEKAASEPFTYIHRGTKLIGDLEAQGRVRVHGTVMGNVRVSGVLEVAEAGVIEGEHIEADEVKILGKVRANVDARGKIEIWKDGQLEGDVRATALDIEEGASFTGRSEMIGHKGTPRLPETAATANHATLGREAAATLQARQGEREDGTVGSVDGESGVEDAAEEERAAGA